MIYGYIRVSTDRQTTENQRFEILKFCDEKRLHIDQWVEETISATKHLDDRQLGRLLSQLKADDVLIVTELSRIGRSILEVMSILHRIMETEAKVFTMKRNATNWGIPSPPRSWPWPFLCLPRSNVR